MTLKIEKGLAVKEYNNGGAEEKAPADDDWSNSNQKKWRVWFEYKAGVGFVVNDTNYDNTNTNTNCSSHLCEIPMAQTLATGWAIIYDNAY